VPDSALAAGKAPRGLRGVSTSQPTPVMNYLTLPPGLGGAGRQRVPALACRIPPYDSSCPRRHGRLCAHPSRGASSRATHGVDAPAHGLLTLMIFLLGCTLATPTPIPNAVLLPLLDMGVRGETIFIYGHMSEAEPPPGHPQYYTNHGVIIGGRAFYERCEFPDQARAVLLQTQLELDGVTPILYGLTRRDADFPCSVRENRVYVQASREILLRLLQVRAYYNVIPFPPGQFCWWQGPPWPPISPPDSPSSDDSDDLLQETCEPSDEELYGGTYDERNGDTYDNSTART